MNRTTIEKHELQQSFGADATLQDVFKQIETNLVAQGEIVCRFLVNGLSLTEEDEKRFAGFRLSEVDLLEVESERPATLLIEVIGNWVDSLPGMIEKSDRLSNTIRLEGMENHLGAFVNLVDSCQFLVQSLMSLRSLCQEIAMVNGQGWKKNEELTARAIAEALATFEKKDFVLLADIMEYDLGHCLQSWLDTLTELKTHVRKKTPDPVGP